VLRWLRSTSRDGTLIVVPVDYYGQYPTPYRETLGAMLDPAVHLVWTGPATVPAAITAEEADAVARIYRRPPLLWDNFPVNDYDTDRLHLTPVAGRAPDLPAHLAGWLANPMPQAEASKVGLATVGAYLGDPHKYDPVNAWRRSLDELGGSADGIAALRRLADNSQSTGVLDDLRPLWAEESTVLGAGMEALFPALAGPWWETALRSLDAELEAQEHLDLGATRNERLVEETRPWIDAVRRNARAGRAAVELVRAVRPRIETPTVVRRSGGYRIRGVIRRPDPAEIQRLRAGLDEDLAAAAQGAQHTHGIWVAYLGAVASAWSACLATPLEVTLDGRAVEVDDRGHFTARSALRANELVASVGPGLSTGLQVPAPSDPAPSRRSFLIAPVVLAVAAAAILIRRRTGSSDQLSMFLLVIPLITAVARAQPASDAVSAPVAASSVETALSSLATALEVGDQASVREAFSPDYRPPAGRGADEARNAWVEALQGLSSRQVHMRADRVETGPSICRGPVIVASRWTVLGTRQDQEFKRAEDTVFSFVERAGRLVLVSTSTVPGPP
jgi:hypothetical protein